MMKKIIIAIVVLAGLGLAWYLLSPLWRNIKLDEASPFVGDSFETMDAATREEMMNQTEAMKDVVMKMEDAMPSRARLLTQGAFLPRAHEVEGKALLIEENGKKILRFEDFKTINGPNLHIYLGADLSNRDFVDLGKIRATEGNVNYEVDASVDTAKYNKVLVWCVPFRVLFSYADLK